MTQDERLLSEFSYPTYEEWRAAAEKTLKGASFEKKLITQTYEGIDLQPIYRKEDTENLPHTHSLPGFPPYVRATDELGHYLKPWHISQEILNPSPQAFNEALRNDMERGQNALHIVVDEATKMGKDIHNVPAELIGKGGVSICCIPDMATAVEGINLEETPLYINAGPISLPIFGMMLHVMRFYNVMPTKVTGCIGMDPLHTLAQTGTLYTTLDKAYPIMASQVAWTRDNMPGLKTILVQSETYHNAGASAIQELACALATGVEYLRNVQAQDFASAEDAALSMLFSFSIGSNFFMEIAKLRAARLLWSKIVAAFGGSDEAQKMVMHVRTSNWNKTFFDPYVNMLRVTTEAFSGVVGGCNSMHVNPFDHTIRQPDEFSRRIARNVHVILSEESHLNTVVDPAGGSWYVETLTDSIARNAWSMFQEIEKLGGMAKALEAGYPQEQIAATAQKRIKNIDQRRDIFVGTNMYPNAQDTPLEVPAIDHQKVREQRIAEVHEYFSERHIEVDARQAALRECGAARGPDLVNAAMYAAAMGNSLEELINTLCGTATDGLPSVPPMQEFSGAERFESLRLNALAYSKQHGHAPQVFLANMGPIPQHKARADFVTGFLVAGGFEILTNKGFATPQEAAEAARSSAAPIVVVCSTDETYPELVPPLVKQIKEQNGKTIVMVAGYPKDQVESLEAAGVNGFIHLRSNCYEELHKLQTEIGVVA